MQLDQDMYKEGSFIVLSGWLPFMASRYLVAVPYLCLKFYHFRLFANSVNLDFPISLVVVFK